MTTLIEVQTPPVSGILHIDALLLGKNDAPNWNYVTPGNNSIGYTFSTTAGIDPAPTDITGTLGRFSTAQQQGVRTALDYISQLTGIKFVETADGNNANFHFANVNIQRADYTGLCRTTGRISFNADTNEVITYKPDAYVYLDNVEFVAQNTNLAVGTSGYQTLLHELGHALGLKHPHEGAIQLPDSEDTTQYTLMSYENVGPTPGQFQAYDIAALNFLYGGDGLRGALGIASTTGALFLTGSAKADTLVGTGANDRFQGNGGGDTINGASGTDTLKYDGVRAGFAVAKTADGFSVTKAGSVDTLANVERVQFNDVSVALDIQGIGGKVYSLYEAALNRAPDLGGLGFHMHYLDKGEATLDQTANGFLESKEFKDTFGANLTDLQFIDTMYKNILNRAGEQAGIDFYSKVLAEGYTRAQVLTSFSVSEENQIQVIAAIKNGFDYIPLVA